MTRNSKKQENRGSSPNSRKALSSSPLKASLTPLTPGEETISLRVRGPAEAVRWFAGLTPAERGQLVERLHAEQQG